MSIHDRTPDRKPSQVQDAALIDAISQAIGTLRYGSLEIVVHDGRVTQIEKREKVRFPQESEKPRSAERTTAG